MNYKFIITAISAPAELILTYYSLHLYGLIGVAWSQVAISLFTYILTLIFGRIALKQRFGNKDHNSSLEKTEK